MMTKPPTFRHASFYGQIGIARADITPPVGICARNWGASKHDVARTIHRPMTLTAMTLVPAASAIFDNFSIEAVPEPSTIVTSLVGMAALCFCGCRRGRCQDRDYVRWPWSNVANRI